MNRENAPHGDGGTPAVSIVGSVLRGIRENALRLSIEARDYFGTHWPPDPRMTALDDRMVMNREMLFISARLSQVVLWALSQGSHPEEEGAPPETGTENGLPGDANEVSAVALPQDPPNEPWTVDPSSCRRLRMTAKESYITHVSRHCVKEALRFMNASADCTSKPAGRRLRYLKTADRRAGSAAIAQLKPDRAVTARQVSASCLGRIRESACMLRRRLRSTSFGRKRGAAAPGSEGQGAAA